MRFIKPILIGIQKSLNKLSLRVNRKLVYGYGIGVSGIGVMLINFLEIGLKDMSAIEFLSLSLKLNLIFRFPSDEFRRFRLEVQPVEGIERYKEQRDHGNNFVHNLLDN
jgi:hypothetical protein